MTAATPSPGLDPAQWDARYRDGQDGWELGQPAPPLQRFLEGHPLDPRADGPAPVLVPGCGRGHEAVLLAARGFAVVGLDFSAEALAEAQRLHGEGDRAGGGRLRWLQADLFDGAALAAAGLAAGSLQGVVEHTCFCAIPPGQRQAYAATVQQLLQPGGWLLGLFWCHQRPGGPPFGSAPEEITALWQELGMETLLWQPAEGSVSSREREWIGLWRRNR